MPKSEPTPKFRAGQRVHALVVLDRLPEVCGGTIIAPVTDFPKYDWEVRLDKPRCDGKRDLYFNESELEAADAD